VFCALHDQLDILGRHAQLTRCFSAVAELLVQCTCTFKVSSFYVDVSMLNTIILFSQCENLNWLFSKVTQGKMQGKIHCKPGRVLMADVQFWKDYQLMWTPSQFGQINFELRIEPDRVWRPDIVLFNK